MKKLLNSIRVVSFILTLLSSIPLFINYLSKSVPQNRIIVDIHVWAGLFFIIFAATSMINKKKN